uniref:Uncharacterized protein n=1 Tax=Neolamprologus brichardi TaxID=32507 RepID=A0A3Q4H142_NEOBR
DLAFSGTFLETEELSGSMMSLFSSGDFGVVEVRGRIQYSLAYNSQREELQVKVYRCEDIAAARKNRSDPVCVLCLNVCDFCISSQVFLKLHLSC